MSTLSVRLPDSLHKRLSELAEREGISINQLINSAVAEKMAAPMTADYLDVRAKRGGRRKFRSVLARVADIEPEDVDRLPAQRTGSTAQKMAPLMRRTVCETCNRK